MKALALALVTLLVASAQADPHRVNDAHRVFDDPHTPLLPLGMVCWFTSDPDTMTITTGVDEWRDKISGRAIKSDGVWSLVAPAPTAVNGRTVCLMDNDTRASLNSLTDGWCPFMVTPYDAVPDLTVVNPMEIVVVGAVTGGTYRPDIGGGFAAYQYCMASIFNRSGGFHCAGYGFPEGEGEPPPFGAYTPALTGNEGTFCVWTVGTITNAPRTRAAGAFGWSMEWSHSRRDLTDNSPIVTMWDEDPLGSLSLPVWQRGTAWSREGTAAKTYDWSSPEGWQDGYRYDWNGPNCVAVGREYDSLSPDYGANMSGWIGEMALYQRVLSASERLTWTLWAQRRYALP